MSQTATKISPPKPAAAAAPVGEKAKKLKKVRPKYDIAKADPAIVKDGKLTAVPTDYVFTSMEKLPKTAFASKPAFLRYRAAAMDLSITRVQKTQQTLRDEADRLEKYGGDDTTAKKVKKAQKAMAELAALKAELAAAGIVV